MEDERYEILDVIGSGGMATVWRAHDRRLGRMVAIKRPNTATRGALDDARFQREARIAAAIVHPNVVSVYDVGVDAAGPYLVMELIDGPSLRDATVTPDRVAEIGAQVASALAALHAAGVVHGDVKPGNILLADGGAKLTDFGIARAVDDTMTLTPPGVALATPAYAAPETLARGERSAAADVFALAAVIHELLTGSRWNAALGSTQPMPAHRWATVLHPALADEPRRRPTAAELAAWIAAVDADGHQTATTPLWVPAPTVPAEPMTPAVAAIDPAPVDGEPRRTGRTAVLLFLTALVIVGAIAIAAMAAGGDGTGTADASTSVAASALPPTPPPTSTSPGTTVDVTIAPATTAPSTTAPPTTLAPTTAPSTAAPTTAPPTTVPRTTADVVDDLVALVDDVPRNELKPKDARSIVGKIDDVVDLAGDRPERAADELGEVADRMARIFDGDARNEAEDLLVELADDLDLDPSIVTDPFDRAG